MWGQRPKSAPKFGEIGLVEGLTHKSQESVGLDRFEASACQECERLWEPQDLEAVGAAPRRRPAFVCPSGPAGDDQRSARGGQGSLPSGVAYRTRLASEAAVRIRKPISARENVTSRP